MCARVLTCPLCSQPGFLTLDALRAGLVNVATRPLICPVCNEVLLGIDKLTIHLFGHTINLNNDTTSKFADTVATNEHLIRNSNDAALQDWTTSKQLGKTAMGIDKTCAELSNSSNVLLNIKDDISAVNSHFKVQNQNLSISDANQSSFMLHYNHMAEINILPQSEGNATQNAVADLQRETTRTNYAMQYFCNDNMKHLNASHEATQAEKMSDFIVIRNVTEPADSKLYRGKTEYAKLNQIVTKHLIEGDQNSSNFSSVQNVMANVGTESSILQQNAHNDKENLSNTRKLISITNAENQNENSVHSQMLPRTQTNIKTLRMTMPREKIERCNICGFHFSDTNILALHKQLVHEQDFSPGKVPKNYSCHLCSKVFKMRGSLMVHTRVAHVGHNSGSFSKDDQAEVAYLSDSGYTCPTCGKKFKKEQHVIQHLKTHEGKQWECDICSKMFTTKYFLKKHKRLHSGEMPYKCKICDKSFTFQQSYHKHRLYHKDDKPHTCATCSRSFKELSTLHNHERIHTGEKPFACETCGKCFRQRVSYLVHRRIHTGVMPYKCTTCGKNFRYKVSQRTHKCPQAPDYTQRLISDTSERDNGITRSQTGDNLQENHSTANTANNEENKFILIINVQGQHVSAPQLEVNDISFDRKEQNIEFRSASNNTRDSKNETCNINDINKTIESIEKVQSEKIDAKNTNNFFSMVMSPLESSTSCPTFEMEHLRVSSPERKENLIDSYTDFPQVSDSLQITLMESNMEHSFNRNKNVSNSLQTINEESLKELLYNMDKK